MVSLGAGTIIVYDLAGGPGTITLTKDGMVINNGTEDTFVVDINGNVTMTSATIRSSATADRIVIDTGGLHSFQGNVERLTVGTSVAKGIKAITTRDAAGVAQGVYVYDTETVDGASRTGQYMTAHGSYVLLDSGGDIRMQDAGSKGFRTSNSGYPEMNDGFGWVPIQKGFSGVSGTVYVSGSSGGLNDVPITFTNGIRTS